MKYIKKYWFIISIVFIILLRFLYSYKIPSFYLGGMQYDDELMLFQGQSLKSGNYLGAYNSTTLIKGIVFPLVLAFSNITKISYSSLFTILYISACLYFVLSLKKIINNKTFILITFILLLFNPISYSSDLFQRLYRNSISIIELLFLLGTIIRIIDNKNYDNKAIIDYFILGVIMSLMFLTREDNIWTIPILITLFIYKLYKNVKIKNIIINLIPAIVLVISLNIVSAINYNHYGIYTYNELKDSSFKDAYLNILRIKEDKKKDKVVVNKTTWYKIIEQTDILGLDKEYIDEKYRKLENKQGEIDAGKTVWYFRNWIHTTHNFKNGKEANKYYKELNKELEKLFKEKKLEKENIIPSIFISTPRVKDIEKIPSSMIEAIYYTSSYKNIRTVDEFKITKKVISAFYDKTERAYRLFYSDYRNTDVMYSGNPLKYEIFRLIYKYLTIILSLVSLVIYFMNIKKLDKLGIIINLLLISYFIILGGVVYTHITAYHAIRYMYLGNVYILQELFIILNIYRIYENKKLKELEEKKELKKKKKKKKKRK